MATQQDLVIIIMAGGAGTRFWPMSTEGKPKQFLTLFGPRSLFQESVKRASALVPWERILVLTNRAFVPICQEQVPEIPAENIIGEPMRRDTAAAIALAATLSRKRFGHPVMGVLTADHVVEPEDLFVRTFSSAADQARDTSALYTFGIVPDYPATGYGYLELGERVFQDGDIEHYRLLRFKEKPDLETALHYLQTKRFLWNSGMFVWRTDTLLAEMERSTPVHLEHLCPAMEADGTPQWNEALREAFEPLPAISIDYAVMESARDVRTVAATFDWKDLGGWLSVEEYLDTDESDNAFRGTFVQMDANANLVFCEDPQELVALIGVDNLVVIRAEGKTLVVPKGRSEEIKALVKKVKEADKRSGMRDEGEANGDDKVTR